MIKVKGSKKEIERMERGIKEWKEGMELRDDFLMAEKIKNGYKLNYIK